MGPPILWNKVQVNSESAEGSEIRKRGPGMLYFPLVPLETHSAWITLCYLVGEGLGCDCTLGRAQGGEPVTGRVVGPPKAGTWELGAPERAAAPSILPSRALTGFVPASLCRSASLFSWPQACCGGWLPLAAALPSAQSSAQGSRKG